MREPNFDRLEVELREFNSMLSGSPVTLDPPSGGPTPPGNYFWPARIRATVLEILRRSDFPARHAMTKYLMKECDRIASEVFDRLGGAECTGRLFRIETKDSGSNR